MGKDVLSIFDLNRKDIKMILKRSHTLKEQKKNGTAHKTLDGRSIGLLFEKLSTRTRISFEVGINDLGANAIFLNPSDLQLGRGETISDTARVLSSYLDAVVMRTFGQERISEFAESADIPVINALTDLGHPTQIISDLFSIEENGFNTEKFKMAFIGDGNNIANSFIAASSIMGFDLSVAVPEGYEPDSSILESAISKKQSRIEITHNPDEAVRKADVIYTDVWVSMGQEESRKGTNTIFDPFQVNSSLISKANKGCIVMHCLPAHEGEEISSDVFEKFKGIIFEQAENKLHVGKAVLEYCFGLV